jgi:regulator of cell morphogenesis and NO signaling
MTTSGLLDPNLTVNEILARHPAALDVFNRLGVDVCCGANLTLLESIEADGLDEETLYDALERALGVKIANRHASA